MLHLVPKSSGCLLAKKRFCLFVCVSINASSVRPVSRARRSGIRVGLDRRLWERDSEVTRLAKLVVVQLHQGRDRVVDRRELDQRHLAVFREKLEPLHVKARVQERLLQVVLLHRGGDVRQVKRWRGRVDVGIVLGARLLETVKIRRGVVLGQSGIWLTVLWELDWGVLARHNPDRFSPKLDLIQMCHGLEREKKVIINHVVQWKYD